MSKQEATIQALQTLYARLDALRHMKVSDMLSPGQQTTFEQTIEEAFAESEPQALLSRTRLIVLSFARVKSLLLKGKEQHQFQPMAFYPIWGSGGRDSSCK